MQHQNEMPPRFVGQVSGTATAVAVSARSEVESFPGSIQVVGDRAAEAGASDSAAARCDEDGVEVEVGATCSGRGRNSSVDAGTEEEEEGRGEGWGEGVSEGVEGACGGVSRIGQELTRADLVSSLQVREMCETERVRESDSQTVRESESQRVRESESQRVRE